MGLGLFKSCCSHPSNHPYYPHPFLCNVFNDICYDESLKVTTAEVEDAIRDQLTGRSAGPDAHSAEHFKHCGHRISVLLSMLFTSCFNYG